MADKYDNAGLLIRPTVKLESDMDNEKLQIRMGEMAAEIERLQSVIDEANAQDPVCKIIRNEAGQVSIKNGEGDYFDMSKYVGFSLYAHPVPEQESQAAAMPDGYCLAPKEPTASMLDAGVAMALQVSVHGEGGWSKYLRGLYKQMLSASPKP